MVTNDQVFSEMLTEIRHVRSCVDEIRDTLATKTDETDHKDLELRVRATESSITQVKAVGTGITFLLSVLGITK